MTDQRNLALASPDSFKNLAMFGEDAIILNSRFIWMRPFRDTKFMLRMKRIRCIVLVKDCFVQNGQCLMKTLH